jgi:hypothetical protein
MTPLEVHERDHDEILEQIKTLGDNLKIMRMRQTSYLKQNPHSWRGVGPGTEVERIQHLLQELLDITGNY